MMQYLVNCVPQLNVLGFGFGHCIIKTFYSNPQYNPTSLCIKGLITASKPTSDQKLKSKQNLWFNRIPLVRSSSKLAVSCLPIGPRGPSCSPPPKERYTTFLGDIMMLPWHRGEHVICFHVLPFDLRC